MLNLIDINFLLLQIVALPSAIIISIIEVRGRYVGLLGGCLGGMVAATALFLMGWIPRRVCQSLKEGHRAVPTKNTGTPDPRDSVLENNAGDVYDHQAGG